MLLGNHESMVTLGNLAWCTTEEFIEFATPGECTAFEHRRTARLYELLALSRRGRVTLPVAGALKAWEEQHAPGRLQYLEAMGPRGTYGRFLRSLPLAIRVGQVLLTHGGLSEAFASAGLLGLHEELRGIWSTVPESEEDVELTSVLLAEDGPLWNRDVVQGKDAAARESLERVLRTVGASLMVVGHTRTDHIPGGRLGHPALLHDDRLIAVDTGIGSSGAATAALVIEGEEISVWRPDASFRTLSRIAPLPRVEGRSQGAGP
jgi:hypothetical protein